jgi:hypothetical protein
VYVFHDAECIVHVVRRTFMITLAACLPIHLRRVHINPTCWVKNHYQKVVVVV